MAKAACSATCFNCVWFETLWKHGNKIMFPDAKEWCHPSRLSLSSPWLLTLDIYLTWHECQPSAAITVLLSDFVSHFGSHYCWFMSHSAEQCAPADKIKFHTSVQCHLPLPWVLILMTIQTAGDDDNEPGTLAHLVSCDEMHPKWIMTLLICWRIIIFDQISN